MFLSLIHLSLTIVTAHEIGDQLAADASFYCSGVSAPVSLSSVPSKMLSQLVGSENYIGGAVYDTTCGDLATCLDSYKGELVWKVARAGFAIIMGLVTLLLWIVMGFCACCRCCRRSRIFCCLKERESGRDLSKPMKGILGILVLLFCAGVVVDVIFASLATVTITKGHRAATCDAYTLASDSINGRNWTTNDTEYTFLGSEELSLTLADLTAALDPASRQIRDVSATINRTVTIENSVNKLLAYLDLTQAMLGDVYSLQVGPNYKCVVCQACCSGENGFVRKLKDIVSSSLSNELRSIRANIASSLTGPGLEDTFTSVNDTNTVIVDFSEKLDADVGHYLVDQKRNIDTGLLLLTIVTIVFIALILGPLTFLLLTFFLAVACKKRRHSGYTDLAVKPPNPCLASFGWCTAMAYAFFILMLGGALLLVGFAEASFCEMASDTDAFIDNVQFRVSSDGSQLGFTKVLQACFKTTGDGDLLGSLPVGNGTARSSLDSVYDLNDQFLKVFSTPPQPEDSFANNQYFLDLINGMRSYGAIYMMDANDIFSSLAKPEYQSLDPSVVKSGLGGNAICDKNFNVDLSASEPMGSMIRASLAAAGWSLSDSSVVTIQSAVDYDAAVTAARGGISLTTGACPYTVTNPVQPYAEMYSWKNAVQAKASFPCFTITESTDLATNVASFGQEPASCANQAEFHTYISTYLYQGLKDAADNLDKATIFTYDTINKTIQSYIQTSILPPVDKILNGTDCQFLGASWERFYDGFCHLETVGTVEIGLTFAAFGALSWIAIFVMFIVWRHLKDNLCLWNDLRKDPRNGARPAIQAQIVNASPAVPPPSRRSQRAATK